VRSQDAKRTAAAHGLARFFTSAEIASAVPGWYLAPPARASVRSFFDQPAYRPLAMILPTARYLPAVVSTGFKEGTIIPKFQAALLGQLTPEEAIAEIQNAARRLALK
jgi:ABC-type glycerol-3-phosphate transport system substrate-binding protein